MTDEWEDLADALRAELANLTRDAVVIISDRDRPGRYVQFAQNPQELSAQAAGEAEDRAGPLSVRDRRLLDAVGWRAPAADDVDGNWEYPLPWPATSDEYGRLAAAVVTALRDVYEIVAPTDLVYRSWEPGGRRRALRLPAVEPDSGYEPDGD